MGGARVLVVGGGAVGLGAAMLLAGDAHDVTVLERNPDPPPSDADEAWAAWPRPGVNQFRMLHMFAARWTRIVEAELPAVIDRLLELGGLRLDMLAMVPEEVTGGRRPSDDRFVQYTGRRPVVEAALASVAASMPNLTIRRGVAACALLTGTEAAPGVPHVVGVRLEDGEEFSADLVVDAAGRRSPLAGWLADLGARPPAEEVDDSGFIYYGRHFRSDDGSLPPFLGGPLQAYDSVSTLTLPGDNGAWGVGIITCSDDAALRRLRDVDTWTRAVASYPLIAHWLDGEPLDDAPAVMAKIEDRYRRYVVDGTPVATGFVAIADAWACTNPSLGRGAAIGMIHAQALRDHLRGAELDDPVAAALSFDEVTMATVEPWYRSTVAFDRHRLAEMQAQIEGVPYVTEDPTWEITHALQHAAGRDPEAFRGLLGIAGVLDTPAEVLAGGSLFARVLEHGAGWRDEPAPGPSRAELLALIG